MEYQIFGMREEIDSFESRLHDYLGGQKGQFEVWLAARDVRRSA